MRERLRALGRLEPVDNVFKLWRRVPGRIRGAVPLLAIVTLAATYPYYVSSLPTDVPVILAFPDVGAAVTILVFVVMAVGLNVVVGYAGRLARLRAVRAGALPLRLRRNLQRSPRNSHLRLARPAPRGADYCSRRDPD